MNLDNEFDELARRKLNEQAFPFEEAHWMQAEQLIAAQRGRKRRGFWLLGAAALLLVSTAAWWMLRDAEVVAEPLASTANEVHTDKATAELSATEKSTDASTPSASSSAQASSANTGTNEDGISDAKNDNAASPATSSATTGTATTNAKASVSKVASTSTGKSSKPQAERNASPKATGGTIASVEASSTGNTTTTGTTSGTSDPQAVEKGAIIPTPALVTSAPTLAAVDAPDQGPAASSEVSTPEATLDHSVVTIDGQAVNVDTLDHTELIMLLTAASTTSPSDSANASPIAAAPAVPPIIADRAPWEISLLGGAFSSNSKYNGGNSDSWSNGITPETTSGYGAELMHMGRNIGLGFGVHYGTYSEKIKVDAIDNTTVERWNYWYLAPVDTTILFITDTVTQNGQTYYVGQSITTTVNVITLGSDSTVTTIRVRDARELRVTTSYFEVPLLFDAHLVQGRWSMGLRGGPTVGLLSGRTGALPNSTNDGYTELGDQAFREVVFGYTARAYIRYRWNAAWSIGIEPAMRGQFSNSLSEGDVQRHSRAFGGMISLSYRLR
jgi:hypothetical protein